MERLRNSIEHALREAERLNQPPIVAGRLPFPQGYGRPSPIDREGQEAEPGKARLAETPPPVPPAPPERPRDLRAALGSRAVLRQAFFLREILGPPRALLGPHEGGR